MLGYFHRDYLCHPETVADGVFHVAKGPNNVGVRQGCNGNDGFLWKDISAFLCDDNMGKDLDARR
jgi:hypothetical protein